MIEVKLTMRGFSVTCFVDYPSRSIVLERIKPVPNPQLNLIGVNGPPARSTAPLPVERVLTDGKFFRLGSKKFYPKGVTYGPFKPDAQGHQFPDRPQVERDFTLVKELNANCLRVYHVPPRWFLDLAQEHDLKLLIECNWPKHTCFLDDPEAMESARRATRQVAEAVAGHPAVFAIVLANEIPPDIARWYGAPRIERFIDELAAIVKTVDPQRLVTMASFPPTEFLQPASLDFVSFNVYLHDPKPFANYLDRLQSLAGGKPLVLTEFGIDSVREGEERKAEILSGHIEIAFRAGLAGAFIFALTDDWYTSSCQIDDWFFGLTDRARKPRGAFHAVAKQFKIAPYFPLPRYPKVSVVVASYNGGRTLPACLDSLRYLNYPDYEVILVDDGSTDDTARIASHYPEVRTIHQTNMGLSAARNTGVNAATGEIVAFTDSDCRADEDWLHYLVGDLLKTDAAAIGGHNFPPPDDNWIAGCVAASPGGPAHVLLDDRNAEHIPGCNMAFWKWALEEIDGFDVRFRAAGDDVDVCWRLLQRDYKITFTHAGFVWHYRRNTIGAYLKQQRGYGIAESLLQRKHPEFFNTIGGMRWRGRIYSPSRVSGFFGRFVIYHGVFGSALFQTLYTPAPGGLLALLTSLEWHVLFTLGGVMLAEVVPPLWPLPVASLSVSLSVAALAAARVELLPKHRRFWARPLIAAMYLLQPIARAWPRYARRLRRRETPPAARATVRTIAQQYTKIGSTHTANYWNDKGIGRFASLRALLDLLDRDHWQSRTDNGWDEFDVTIYGDRFSKVTVKTVSENHGGNKRLLRVRLVAGWTLLGKVTFCCVIGGTLVLHQFLRHAVRSPLWPLAPLPAIPLFAFYLHVRARRTLRLGLALMDLAAQELGLMRLATPKKKS
jgi:GT2 family glycosyltransferase